MISIIVLLALWSYCNAGDGLGFIYLVRFSIRLLRFKSTRHFNDTNISPLLCRVIEMRLIYGYSQMFKYNRSNLGECCQQNAMDQYRLTSSIRRTKSQQLNISRLVSSCRCLCSIHWSPVLVYSSSREWSRSWLTTSEWLTIYCPLRWVLHQMVEGILVYHIIDTRILK